MEPPSPNHNLDLLFFLYRDFSSRIYYNQYGINWQSDSKASSEEHSYGHALRQIYLFYHAKFNILYFTCYIKQGQGILVAVELNYAELIMWCYYTSQIRWMQKCSSQASRRDVDVCAIQTSLKDCNAQDTSCLCAPSGQSSGAWQGPCNPDCFGLPAEGEVFWQMWLPDLSNSRCSLKGGMTDEPPCKAA